VCSVAIVPRQNRSVVAKESGANHATRERQQGR
jgi:hypothetical protein